MWEPCSFVVTGGWRTKLASSQLSRFSVNIRNKIKIILKITTNDIFFVIYCKCISINIKMSLSPIPKWGYYINETNTSWWSTSGAPQPSLHAVACQIPLPFPSQLLIFQSYVRTPCWSIFVLTQRSPTNRFFIKDNVPEHSRGMFQYRSSCSTLKSWNISFKIIKLLLISPSWSLAHAMTAVLSWHVLIFSLIQSI